MAGPIGADVLARNDGGFAGANKERVAERLLEARLLDDGAEWGDGDVEVTQDAFDTLNEEREKAASKTLEATTDAEKF